MGRSSSISVTDMFCGAGGSSQGARRLGLEVQLAMNHWELAVETHNTNFPNTHHDVADLRVVHPGRYWPTTILLASPECTNHSVAKGVKRRRRQLSLFDEEPYDPAAVRSRATMWSIPEYAEHHGYDMIVVENVVDARHWLPWDGWLLAMRNLGYEHEVVYLNSMFCHMRPLANPEFGDFAPQSRDRLYCVFWKKKIKRPDLEIRPLAYCPIHGDVEAIQSWKRPPGAPFWKWGRYGAQYVYRCAQCGQEAAPYFYCAANAIDWSLPTAQIGERAKPLKERTLQRVQKGLDMFAGQHLVIDVSRNYGDNGRSLPVFRAPLNTQTTAQASALLMLPFTIETLFTDGGRRPRSLDEALPSQTTRQSAAVVMPPFVLGYANQAGPARGTDELLRTFHTENERALVIPFIANLRGTNRPNGVDEALSTICAGGQHHALAAPFTISYYGANGNHRPVDREMGTVTAADRHALVQPGERAAVEQCGFRMLEPHEIRRGMAFDDGYIVLGTKREQVRQLGNAVTPVAEELLLERCVASLS